MLIYRIQNADDKGCLLENSIAYSSPYYSKLQMYRSSSLSDGSDRRQHPDDDLGTDLQKIYFKKEIYYGSKYIFGFANKNDLYTWFTPVDLGWYEGHGYCVYTYDIPTEHIIFGTRQLCFDPAYAQKKVRLGHRKLRLS